MSTGPKPIPPQEPLKEIKIDRVLDHLYDRILLKELIDMADKAGAKDAYIEIDCGYDNCEVSLRHALTTPNPHYEKEYAKYLINLEKYKVKLAEWNSKELVRKQKELEQIEKRAKKLRKELKVTE